MNQYVGSTFRVEAGDRTFDLKLINAAKVMESEAARLRRAAFSLFFVAPVLLPQQIYRITHEAFAEPMDIFLVPIGKDANGYLHEAVFT